MTDLIDPKTEAYIAKRKKYSRAVLDAVALATNKIPAPGTKFLLVWERGWCYAYSTDVSDEFTHVPALDDKNHFEKSEILILL